MNPAAPPTQQDYISWVQRSFNRILRQSEVTDGIDTPIYHDRIQMFQMDQKDLAVTREIHPVDQNRIIQLNHADTDYMRWVRGTLRDLGVTELADQSAIGAFQKSVTLGSDGWVGARTETAMIANSKSFPPGHQIAPKHKPVPPPADLSMLARFLQTDDASAKIIAPATIVPFANTVSPDQTEAYMRRRLAAAVRVAKLAHLRLTTLASKSNTAHLWNSSAKLEMWWFGQYSEVKFDKVLSTFSHIIMHLTDPRLKVVGNANKADDFGSASPGIRKITLGGLWVSPGLKNAAEDDAERVQTYVHEAAHISGRVIAFEKRHSQRVNAHALVDSGMRATRNADNYGYYAIDVAVMWC